jgi:hypothetical protein
MMASRRPRAGGGTGDSAAIREQFPRVVEQHDTVAEQAPPFLGMAGHNMRGAAVWCLRIRARWLVLTHLILRNGIVILGVAAVLGPGGCRTTLTRRPGSPRASRSAAGSREREPRLSRTK